LMPIPLPGERAQHFIQILYRRFVVSKAKVAFASWRSAYEPSRSSPKSESFLGRSLREV